MHKITVEGVLDTQHRDYREPKNAQELLETLYKFVPTVTFKWQITELPDKED